MQFSENKDAGLTERRMVAAMIGKRSVVGPISSKWNGKPISENRAANMVINKIMDYFREVGKPIGVQGIKSWFEDYAETAPDQALVSLMDQYLTGVLNQIEEVKTIASEHLLDLSGKFLERKNYSRVRDGIDQGLASGRLEIAERAIASYSKVELGTGVGVDLFLDKEEVISTFDNSEEVLVEYPGDLGRFFYGQLTRNSFIAFTAPDKTGKSWFLLDLAYRAMLARKKVAFFQVGDLSRKQINKRFMIRAARKPIRSPDGKWPFVVDFPKSIAVSQEGFASVETKPRKFTEPLNSDIAWEAFTRVVKNDVKSDKSYFKLHTCPAGTINVPGIKGILDSWEMQYSFLPDVVVVDYADILAPPHGKWEQKRDAINETWIQLRALADQRHCLVATATQSDAEAYSIRTLTRRNFSEDKRKLAHCTSLVGINQMPNEKRDGVARLNVIVGREVEFSILRCCHVAMCLALANPCVQSIFP